MFESHASLCYDHIHSLDYHKVIKIINHKDSLLPSTSVTNVGPKRCPAKLSWQRFQPLATTKCLAGGAVFKQHKLFEYVRMLVIVLSVTYATSPGPSMKYPQPRFAFQVMPRSSGISSLRIANPC